MLHLITIDYIWSPINIQSMGFFYLHFNNFQQLYDLKIVIAELNWVTVYITKSIRRRPKALESVNIIMLINRTGFHGIVLTYL